MIEEIKKIEAEVVQKKANIGASNAPVEAPPEDEALAEGEALDSGKKSTWLKTIKMWVIDIAIAIAIALVFLQFFNATIIRQVSMEDTLYDGDKVLYGKQAYLFSDAKRGDIIIFKSDLLDEKGKKMQLIKRVIGIPGDKIRIKDGDVYVNDEKQVENYVKGNETFGDIDTTVPEDKLFCMGDNRSMSLDSRDPSVGFVPEKTIRGKALLRYWPFNEFKVLK